MGLFVAAGGDGSFIEIKSKLQIDRLYFTPMRHDYSLPVSTSRFPNSGRSGFALIIALGLMSFIFLLLVSMGTMVRVSLSTESQATLTTQARQNALMGLNIAIGELQWYAGPDQRVTATSSILGASETQVGTKYWTGVWGNAGAADDTREPELLNWLVSGNEEQKESISFSMTGSSFGQIQSAGNPAVKPDEVLSPSLTAGASAQTDFKIGATDARLLVGAGTLGTATGAEDGYVLAPLVTINESDQGIGVENRYAYWVGDEGVKARINLVNPWPQSAGGTDAAKERISSFGMAQRAATEQIYGLESLPSGALAENDFLEKVVNNAQLSFLSSSVNSSNVQARFQDITPYSLSVLADSRHGGLKRDLTQILRSGGGNSDEADDKFIFPTSSGSYGPSGSAFYTQPPTWGLLRDFAGFQDSLSDWTTPLQSQTPTSTRQGISPIIVYGGMVYSWRVLEDADDPQQMILSVYASPRFFLWNPYNRPLEGGTFEIGFIPPRKDDSLGEKGIITFDFAESTLTSFNNYKYYFNVGKGGFVLSPTNTDREMMRFRVDMPRNWEPGEVVSFSLPSGTDTVFSSGNTTLSPEQPVDPRLYAADARLLMASQVIPMAAPVSDPNASWSIKATTYLRNMGEVSMFLGEPGAGGAGASAAIDPGSGNHFYQWIGRVEPMHHNSGNPEVIEVMDDAPMIDSYGEAISPRNILNYEIYHKLSIANVYQPSLPVKWIAAGNSRAYMQNRTGMESGDVDDLVVNPLYVGYSNCFEYSTHRVPFRYQGEEATIGNDYNNTSYGERFVRPALFEVPSQVAPLLSIADLRHANTSIHATGPSYAIGNSLADFRIGRDQTSVYVGSGYLDPLTGAAVEMGPLAQTLYDQSYLLNDALWDRYYFSTLPDSGTLQAPLPNSRHLLLEQDGVQPTLDDLTQNSSGSDDPVVAASKMMLEGGFNVNSTSVEAWRAVLSGLNGLAYDPTDPTKDDADTLINPFSRYRITKSRSERPVYSGSSTEYMVDYWSGYREMTDDELTGLAQRIVEQVKLRGPFLSLADFVNRSLDGDDEFTLKGAIQAAIDDEGAGNSAERINYVKETNSTEGGGRHLSNYTDAVNYGYGDGWSSSYDLMSYLGYAGANSRDVKNNPFTRTSTFAPGDITQGDVLAAIGPSLATRSDTFTIRAYGEVLNALDSSVKAQAWCEAVVQRMPDYMDDTDSAETAPAELVSQVNKTFGRRFVVTSFRWLGKDDV
ncbi:hypothetical protein H5P28_13365 [Ruficoccus amylovorans]|uniref:Verru_Chthon cassette protein A n=1 Tax=Ruficoccus amylovorans TaxID=1804625 RepID=A0A842HJB1_9BACT|nr:hypothetical protein [Ruficoccus amylovorans]MBC2595251.1 hypothetical protein [Ruficoccus amylovorans]